MRARRSCTRCVATVATSCLLAIAAIVFIPGSGQAGDLEPPGPPGPTMHTLDQIPPSWSEQLETADGDPGTGCNSTRFVCVLGGQGVLDRQTGLTWTRNANQGQTDWLAAISTAYNVVVYWAQKGWRLPTPAELASLVEEGATNPSLPPGHPFQNVQWGNYWTSKAYEGNTTHAWVVNMSNSIVTTDAITDNNFVWVVRGPE